MTTPIQKKVKTAINPIRDENYAEWYQQVIKAADLAETTPVRGCMVIKPWGYGIWENIQSILDKMFKDTGHKNAYFPLFIPKSLLEKEASHVEGFAKECAVVTHHRLESDGQGGLKPTGELEEPYIVRPTSETIIGEMYARWINSYRDLPILINQWANVVRWEMRTRLFLRTAEFLWQEGHTAHATKEEAWAETVKMLNVYVDFAENYLAVPVYKGEKSESERFPGALNTLCIEAMMQDFKALQMGTSHFLGQNFSKAANIKFQSAQGQEEYAWTTSWGVSTRLIGGLIMTHSDDNGLILPPRVATSHIVIMPIIHKEESRTKIMDFCQKLAQELREKNYDNKPVRVELDDRDMRGGDKNWDWIKKGIPVRMEIGEREVNDGKVCYTRRDHEARDRSIIPLAEFTAAVADILQDIQNNLFNKAKTYRDEQTKSLTNKDDFYTFFSGKQGQNKASGFAKVFWGGDTELEEKLKKDLNATIRCIPFDNEQEYGTCIFTGKSDCKFVYFGKSY